MRERENTAGKVTIRVLSKTELSLSPELDTNIPDNGFQVDYGVYAIVIGALCAFAMLVITVGLSIYLAIGKLRRKEQQNPLL